MVLTKETIKKENPPRWSGNIAVDFIEVGGLSKDGRGIVCDKFMWTNRYSLGNFVTWMNSLIDDFGARVVASSGWDFVLATKDHKYICRIEGMDQQKEANIDDMQNILSSFQ